MNMTITDIQQKHGVSPRTIRRAIASGALPPLGPESQQAQQYIIDELAVLHWLAHRRPMLQHLLPTEAVLDTSPQALLTMALGIQRKLERLHEHYEAIGDMDTAARMDSLARDAANLRLALSLHHAKPTRTVRKEV